MQRCSECGFDFESVDRDDVARLIDSGAGDVAHALIQHADTAAARRNPAVWSPLEYGCHVRDLLLVQRERVLAAQRRDTPTLEPMGREERVVHDGYAAQDPVKVAGQLSMAATMFAWDLDRLDESGWARLLVYNYPAPAERTLAWVAIHTLHEVHHHRMDVDRQIG